MTPPKTRDGLIKVIMNSREYGGSSYPGDAADMAPFEDLAWLQNITGYQLWRHYQIEVLKKGEE